ncbi:unnamed protein product [Didymodactylos carnosus]|uniref:Uncharacterized protein n=1 Tax=Didymodactylos carnosus TaxID=1234261 RepID=A0A815MM25_9BILA|nr:unnamed protein product [Didymodactylos carnosus]CAF4305969.1 unnamed protein product [Didymodactylos carnosus]
MIVELRLIFPIDCLTLICQSDTVRTVTTQIFIVIRFDESLFEIFFGLTTSSGGNGSSSNNNSTTLQIQPTSTVTNQIPSFSVLISTIMPTTGETRQRQPTSFSSEKTTAFTKEHPQTRKIGTNTSKGFQTRGITRVTFSVLALSQETGRTKHFPLTRSEASKQPKPTKPAEIITESTSSVRSFTSLFPSETPSASRATSNQPQTGSFTSSTSGT